jgi:hypothetical protein
MNSHTQRRRVAGPAGDIDCAIDEPTSGQAPIPARGVAVLCHPHPQHGGTMDNKVVATLARAFVQLGWRAVRFNFRGVGQSAGHWDEGRGEVNDVLAVVAAVRAPESPLVLGGFSFGASMAARAAGALPADARASRLVMVGPAVKNFAAPAVPADTIVIHGEADEVVPLAAVLDWARPSFLPVIVVPGTGHFFHGHMTLLKQIILRAWAQPDGPR